MPAPTQAQRDLRAASRPLSGHGKLDVAGELERVARVIRDEDIRPDHYGAGAYLEAFEAELAELFGFEAARFMPSGCMAQPIAMRIWAARKGVARIGLHPTSHLELHEEFGYRELHGLESELLPALVEADRPTLARDLAAALRGSACAGAPLAALLIELPARELGGQLPSWTELADLADLARTAGVALHLDGARIWEVEAAYDRPLAEIAGHFDSAYVSFYKGIGALPGAMLLGDTELIAEAAVWQRRAGGTLHNHLPAVVSARTRIAERRALMPRFHERAREVAALIQSSAPDAVGLVPAPPQTNMFHLVATTGSPEDWSARRDRAAAETGIWLTYDWHAPAAHHGPHTTAWTELVMSDASLALEDDDLARALRVFFERQP